MIGLQLLLLGVVIAVGAPRLLGRARWVYRSPRLGIAAWYAALLAVTSATAGGLAALATPWGLSEAPACIAWRWCALAAQGRFGLVGRALAVAVPVALIGIAGRLVLCGLRLVRQGMRTRREHAQMLKLAGQESVALQATVIDSPQPAAYVVAGGDRRVVVTTGALEHLTTDELAAVLAHERAHVTGRHDLLLTTVRLLDEAFPRVGLFRAARHQLSRLVEIRADEVAVSHHPSITLARALVTMATGATTRATPASALPASGGDATERLRRLLDPPDRMSPLLHATIVGGIAAVAVSPVALLVSERVLRAVVGCLHMLA
jgi:Zn-dependent protease with chaperone function